MGIGIALATGLVQGFTQNIQEEKARRAGEQEKLDSYRAILTQTALDPGENYNAAAAKKLGTMIQNAQGRLDSRERVNIFGQEGDKVNVDFTDVLTTLTNTSSTADYYTLNIGSGTLKVNKKYNDPTTDAGDKANMFMEALGREYGTSEGKLAFLSQFQTQADRDAFEKEFTSQTASWVSQRMFDGDNGKIVDIDPTKTLQVYAPTTEFLGWNEDKEYNQIKQAAAARLQANDIPDTHLLLPIGSTGNEGASAVPMADIGITTEMQISGLQGLASLHNMDVNKFVYTFGKQFKGDRTQFFGGLNHAINLFNLNAHEPRTQQDIENVGNYMLNNEDLKNDAIARAYAMTPFVVDMQSPMQRTLNRLGLSVSKDVEFAEEFKKITGQSLVNFDKQTAALYKGRKNLSDLISKVEASGVKAGGIVAKTFMQIYGFFGTSGTIDQTIGILSGGGSYEEEGDEARIEAIMKSELQGVSEDIAAARTLAFIAAADLARAEDESGRLSDQDFLRNYRKLGVEDSGGVETQLTQMKTVLEEVNQKFREIEVLDGIVSRNRGKKGIVPEDRILLQGDSMARFFVKKFYDSGNVASGEVPSAAAGMTKQEFLSLVPTGEAGPMPIASNVRMADGTTGNLFLATVGGKSVYRVDTGGDELISVSLEDAEKLIAQGSAATDLMSQDPANVGGSGSALPSDTLVQQDATTSAASALLPDERGDLSTAPSPVDPAGVLANEGPDMSATPAPSSQPLIVNQAQAVRAGLSLPNAGLDGGQNTGNVLYEMQAYPGKRFRREKIRNEQGRQTYQYVEVTQ